MPAPRGAYRHHLCWIVGGSGTPLQTIDSGGTLQCITAPRLVDRFGVKTMDERSTKTDELNGVSFRTEDNDLACKR